MSNSEPLHKKRKMSPPPHSSSSTSWSMLPDEMVLSCLARVSRSDQAALSLVSKSHRSLVASPDLYRTRSLLGCAENCLYVCLLVPPGPIPRWFILRRRGESVNRVLSPIPSLPCQPLEASSVVVLDWGIYVIGGLKNGKPTRDVWLLDCRTHTWSSVPPMYLPRANAVAGIVDGKIYVMGGFLFYCRRVWGEVFDPKTQTWECLPRREENPWFLHDSVVKDQKVYAVDAYERVFYYSPREGIWGRGSDGERLGVRHWCMVDDVLYCISPKGSILWYEPEELDWRDPKRVRHSKEVKGLGSLKKGLSSSRLVNCDAMSLALWDQGKIRRGRSGKMVDSIPGARLTSSGPNILIFWDVVEGDRLEIWCAEISLERRRQGGDEIWGNVEWSNAVMTLDPFLDRYKVTYTASVIL